MTRAGEVALRLRDQGWRGLLPLLPPDAAPHVHLSPEKTEGVAGGSSKAPGPQSEQLWGARPTAGGWYPSCPACRRGWVALLPVPAEPDHYGASRTGCTHGCGVEDIAWWFTYPALEPRQRRHSR